MKTICFFNLKGGVGKTMTTANLAHQLSKNHGKRVLCIDADSQGNLSQYFGIKAEDGSTTADLIRDGAGYYPDFVTPTRYDTIDVIPSGPELMDIDVAALREGRGKLFAIEDLRTAISNDCFDLQEEVVGYDYMFIDCPPSFSASSMAALAAADEVIIPIKLDAFSTDGMTELIRQVKNMQSINSRLSVRGLLVTQFVGTPEEGAVLDFLRKNAKLPVFSQVIRYSKRVSGSTFAVQCISEFSPTCGAAIDYRKLAVEVVGVDEYGI